MHRYNRYSCLYLVPKDEYEYLKEDYENNKNTDSDSTSDEYSNNDGVKDIHQVNNIRVTKGANVIIRGERDEIHGANTPYQYKREVGEEKAEENRVLNDEYTGAEKEGEKRDEDSLSIPFKKKKKKKKKAIPQSIGENVQFPLFREEARVHSELPLQMKRANNAQFEPYFPSSQSYGQYESDNPQYYHYNNPLMSNNRKGSTYSYSSSAPSLPKSSTEQDSVRDVTMRTVSSYPSIKNSRGREPRRESISSSSTLPSSPSYYSRRREGRRESTSSTATSSSFAPSSTSSKINLKPPSLILPLPDKDEPMPLASGVARERQRNKEYLRQIVADRLDTLRGKKRKPPSSIASSQKSVSFRPPPKKTARPKYEFPLGKRENPFPEQTARKKIRRSDE